MHNSNGYSRMQVILHWVIVLLIAGQYLLHGGIEAAWQGRLDGTLPDVPFPNPHAIVGMVILALALWRVSLRLRVGAPPLAAEEPPALRLLAAATHIAFYALLIGMPVSGALAWVAGLHLPAEAHEIAAKGLLALIALHIVGAIAQQVVFKTGVMARMSPKRMLRADEPTARLR
jgi:cytochrome b561